jgi:hypothetical protein
MEETEKEQKQAAAAASTANGRNRPIRKGKMEAEARVTNDVKNIG